MSRKNKWDDTDFEERQQLKERSKNLRRQRREKQTARDQYTPQEEKIFYEERERQYE